jgi:REP element-mobilizing transposase RayT
MVHAYHAIISAYGFWLPNDPRGSWSDFVGSWELFKAGGPATKTTERRSLAHDPHDARRRWRMKAALKHPPVRFTPAIRELIGVGFGVAVREGDYRVMACCIGHDHAHLVLGRHERSVEQMLAHLKSKASMEVGRAGVHPLAGYADGAGRMPSIWSEGCWKVFIDNATQLHAAVEYVRRHPVKEGLEAQAWGFVRG